MICQAAEPRTAFDVASLKPHPGEITFSADPSVSGTRVTATAVTLADLLTSAVGVRYDQISGGPSWAASDRYDLAARAAGEAVITKAELRQMLQALLAERFHLKFYREMKDVPSYVLVVGKGGPKLQESAADAPGNSFVRAGVDGMHMEAASGTMEQLARQLSNTAGRPVLDKTGLAGHYAFKLDWIPPDKTPGPDSNTPDLFTALREQLGFRLDAAPTPIEILVIEGAEKPAAN